MPSTENNKDVFMVVEGGSLRGLCSKISQFLRRDVLIWQTLIEEDIEGRVTERKMRNKPVQQCDPHVSHLHDRFRVNRLLNKTIRLGIF